MADETGVGWCDSTFDPWIGCTKISPACDNCYAEASVPSRTMGIEWGQGKPRHKTSDSNWRLPINWHNAHPEFWLRHNRKRRVFCASLADVFDNEADPAWRAELFELILALTHLDWLILTKRIGNAPMMLPEWWGCGLDSVWLGISVANQAEFDRDAPQLLAAPAKIRWLSLWPMLGPITIPEHLGRRIDWIVVGGESGHHARPMQKTWVESIRNQCRWFNIPLFFKQWGGGGRRKGGCLFDGVEIKNWPTHPDA